MLILTSFLLPWSSKEQRHEGKDRTQSLIFVCRCIVVYDVYSKPGETIPSSGNMANERLFKGLKEFIHNCYGCCAV